MVSLGVFSPKPWVHSWGDNHWSWNVFFGDDDEEDRDRVESDYDGQPGQGLVGEAVAFWTLQNPNATALDIASVFNLSERLASEAFEPGRYEPCDLGTAVQTWSLLVGGFVPVGLASAVFGLPPSIILNAISDHVYMYIENHNGIACIGHEGE